MKKTKKTKAYKTDRVAQVVGILATVMAASYIIIRIINWIRFFKT